MDTNNLHSESPALVQLTDQMKKHLLETSKWSKFLSILGFIGLGLMILGALAVLIIGVSFGTLMGSDSRGILGAIAIALVYLVIALIYFFPCYYLFRSSMGIQNGIQGNNMEQLESGISNLKSHYKFLGIMMIVIISMYILIMVFAVLVLSFRG